LRVKNPFVSPTLPASVGAGMCRRLDGRVRRLGVPMTKILVLFVALASMVGCGGGIGVDGDVFIPLPDMWLNDGAGDGLAIDVAPDGQIQPDSVRTDLPDATSGDEGDNTDEGPVDSGADHGQPPDDVVDNDADKTDVAATDLNQPDVPRCFLGQDECLPDSSTNRKTCPDAQILGRFTLLNGGISWNSDTINENSGGNEDDDDVSTKGCPIFGGGDDLWCKSECDDDGLDHFFRVFLVAGDLFSFTVDDHLIYNHPDWGIHIDFMVKVYRGWTCPLERESLLQCVNQSDGNRPTYNNVQIKPMSESEAGWYTIVIDSTGSDHAGTYSLSASLFQNSEYTGDWNLCCDF